MKEIINTILAESLRVKESSISNAVETLKQVADRIASCLASGHKLLIFGNGGSAADAQHIAAEFVNRFRIERPPLAAVALTTDASIITSIGNDYSFDEIFSKQVAAIGQKGDLAWGISTSGNSPNVLKAIYETQKRGLSTLGMTGKAGKLSECCDLVLRVDSEVTARIQETHITMAHILCEVVDRILFNPNGLL